MNLELNDHELPITPAQKYTIIYLGKVLNEDFRLEHLNRYSWALASRTIHALLREIRESKPKTMGMFLKGSCAHGWDDHPTNCPTCFESSYRGMLENLTKVNLEKSCQD